MRQTRLESYFQVPPSHPPRPGASFLDLPYSVRRQVYKYAGLIGITINLNFANLIVYPRKAYPDRTFCLRFRCHHERWTLKRITHEVNAPEDDEWKLTRYSQDRPWKRNCNDCNVSYNLMFISKHISAEVIDLVYSKNNFTVRQGHPYSLKRLKLMGGSGLASLTSLTIRLDWANKYAWGVTDDDVFDEIPGPISISCKYRYNIFLDFQALIKKLSRSIRPQALKLYLIFCA